jgi:hypothetical protein
VLAPEGGTVLEDRVDLPPLPVRGALDPELVLPRVAAGGLTLVDRGQPERGEAGLLGIDCVGAGNLDTERLRLPPWPGFSIRMSLSGGSAMAKLA